MTENAAQRPSFKLIMSKSETKAEITDRTARSILEAEARERRVKTEKLRNARLARQTRASAHDAIRKTSRRSA